MTKNRICATATGLPKLTRRSLLTAAPAIAAGGLPCFASTPESAGDMLSLWLAERDYVNSHPEWPDKELNIACQPMDELERRIMAAPILTARDLATKVVVYTDFGVFDGPIILRQSACFLGELHRIPDFILAGMPATGGGYE